MKIALGTKPTEEWKPVTVPGGSFEVLVRRPSIAQRTRNLAFQVVTGKDRSAVDIEADAAAFRLEAVIVDWRGLETEDGEGGVTPVPFNPRWLEAVCNQFPAVYNQLALLAVEAFRTRETETPEGN